MSKIKKLLQKENTKNIIILFVVSIFICIPLLSSKIDVMQDDGVQHIARLMGTYQSLEEGQVFPVIMSKFCNNFGYSWNLFYSPLTTYIPLIFKLFGASFINCIKLFVFFITFISGITMYFFTKEVTKNSKIALFAGIFYIFAPYRLTDMYIRNALAELTSFVFIPMIFQGLYGILNEKKNREYILIIGLVGLILTHLVITMYVAIICVIYLLTQIKKLKNKTILLKLVLCAILTLLITSFFLLPLLEHKLSANYEVFKEGRMERTDVLIAFKLNFLELFITPKNNTMIYEIGLLSIILLILSPIVIKKLKEEDKVLYKFYKFSLIVGLICIFMTLNIFPFEKLPSILKMLQFTFRLLEFSSFFFSFVVAVNLVNLLKKLDRKDTLFVILILMLLTTYFIPHLKFSDNINEEKLYPAINVTSNTR